MYFMNPCGFHSTYVCRANTSRNMTYSVEQSRSWEANMFSASQGMPHIRWNPKVHYRTTASHLFLLTKYFFSTGATTHGGFVFCSHLAPQSVGLLWTSDQSVAETSNWQNTTLPTDKQPCPGGIRTHDHSRRATVDRRRRGYWDRH